MPAVAVRGMEEILCRWEEYASTLRGKSHTESDVNIFGISSEMKERRLTEHSGLSNGNIQVDPGLDDAP